MEIVVFHVPWQQIVAKYQGPLHHLSRGKRLIVVGATAVLSALSFLLLRPSCGFLPTSSAFDLYDAIVDAA